MDNIMDFEIHIFEECNTNIVNSDEFHEFCETLDQLAELAFSVDPFTEKVTDPQKTVGEKIGQAAANTAHGVGSAVGTYNKVTDAGGSMIKGFLDLAMQCINMAASAASFIMKRVGDLPRMVSGLITKSGQITSEMRNKIRGNIQVYISAEDIQMLYNQSLMRRIASFVLKANALSQGTTWGTFFHRNEVKLQSPDGTVKSDDVTAINDSKLMGELRTLRNQLGGLKLEPTVIEMKSPVTVAMYFGGTDDPPIIFKDLNGKEHKCFYVQALQQLSSDLKDQSKLLEKIYQDIQNKRDNATGKSDFVNLSGKRQAEIADALNSVSTVIRIIGNFVRYCMADINTVNDALEAIIKKGGIAGRAIKEDDIDFMMNQNEKRQAAAEARKRQAAESRRKQSGWNNDSNANIDPRKLQKEVNKRLATQNTTYGSSGAKKSSRKEKRELRNLNKDRARYGV